MEVTKITAKRISFPIKTPLRVAFGILYSFDSVLVKMETDCGLVGYGECSPLPYVTGESIETVLAVLEELKPALIGLDPHCIARAHAEMDAIIDANGAAKAGLDMALYDLAAKSAGVPLYRYLGGYRNEITLDQTVGLGTPEEMAVNARSIRDQGFCEIKVKLGEGYPIDVARIAAIRAAVGPEPILRVDANQGWDVATAVRIIRALMPYEVELIEQPTPYRDINALAEIRAKTDLPIVADESCHLPSDAARLAQARAVDGINIKLMKCGGIFRAMQINAVAEANGIFCMVGCMGESRLANAAGMHFVAANKNIIQADLDGFCSIDCPWMTGGFTNDGGRVTLGETPGIGIELDGFDWN